MDLKRFEKWFANKGHVLQFALTFLGFCLALIVAWPTLQANKILAPGSLLYFVVAILVFISCARIIPYILKEKGRSVYGENELPCYSNVYTVELSAGDKWKEPGDHSTPMAVILNKVVNDPVLAVEIEVDHLFRQAGSLVTLGADTYLRGGKRLVPISNHSDENAAVFSFYLTEHALSFFALRVDHANFNAQTATLFLARVVGSTIFGKDFSS